MTRLRYLEPGLPRAAGIVNAGGGSALLLAGFASQLRLVIARLACELVIAAGPPRWLRHRTWTSSY